VSSRNENIEVNRNPFMTTYEYRPMDCYVNVRGSTIRPIVVTSSEEKCDGFGDECMHNLTFIKK
jgi:hypothetical protein